MTSMAQKVLRSQLIGYTLKDRRKELQEALRIKTLNLEQTRTEDVEMLRLLDHIIHHMRQNNIDSQNLIRQQGDHENQLIKGVLAKEKRERLELGRSTIQKAKDVMFDKYSEKNKVVDIIQYILSKQEKKLLKMTQELEYLESYSVDTYDQELEKVITTVENKIDKIKTRYETAFALNEKYQKILDKFDQEARTLPGRLEAMETALRLNIAEQRDLAAMTREAVATREKVLSELQRVSRETSEASTRREKTLMETHRTMNMQNQEFDKLKKKKTSMDYHTVLDPKLEEEMEEIKMETLRYQTLFDTIKSGSLVPEIKDFIALIVNFDDNLSDQKIRRKEMEQIKKDLTLEKQTLQSTCKELKFTGAESTFMRKKVCDDLRNNVMQLETNVTETKAFLQQNGDICLATDRAVDSLLSKLVAVKTHDMPYGSICERLHVSMVKLNQLMHNIRSEAEYVSYKDTMACTLYQEPLESFSNQLAGGVKKQDSLSDFDFGADSNAPSRDEIKRRSRLVISAHQKYPSP